MTKEGEASGPEGATMGEGQRPGQRCWWCLTPGGTGDGSGAGGERIISHIYFGSRVIETWLWVGHRE